LAVFGAGEDYERLAEIERLLELPPEPPAEPPDSQPIGAWRRLSPLEYEGLADRSQYGGSLMTDSVDPADGGGAAQVDFAAESAQFVSRPFGLGTIVAIGSDGKQPLSANLGAALANLSGARLSWVARHGVRPGDESSDFWTWLIPSVKLAPVTAFRVLITLFVIAIGPVNYFVLRRLRRTYLMLATAPLAAVAVTVLLFGYALARDGLDTKSRIRSLTYLDQRTGLRVDWSRQTHFAAFAPANGMLYPDDAAIYPLAGHDFAVADRRLDWRGDQQRLAWGYLPARETAQMMVLRAAQAAPGSGLEIREAADAASPPQCKNDLGTGLRQLLIVDAQGNAWWAENVSAGATAAPAKLAPGEGRGRLIAIHVQHALRPPAGIGGFWPGGGPYTNYEYFDELQSSSVLERGLADWLGASPGEALQPRSYVAIVESPAGVPLGVPHARQEAGLHVVVGRW
jgi:hypothetical protein